jgi:hypothetical protein
MRLPTIRARAAFAAALFFSLPEVARPQCSGDLQTAPAADVDLQFQRRFQGSYRHGEPYDVVTVLPNGGGDTLEGAGITLRLRIYCEGYGRDLGPIAGLPASEIVLYSPALPYCVPMTPSGPTDAEGWTEFTGTFQVGGCVDRVQLFVLGVLAATIPVRFNSPDTGSASPLAVDRSDLPLLAAHFGVPAAYSICFDYNEDGKVDGSDLSFFAATLGAACR